MRPEIDEYFIAMAKLVATRTTCKRRSVGCVLVDRHKRVLSTGYNGAPPGVLPHCINVACPGVEAPSGQGLDKCIATHAETNALLFCPDIMKVDTIYLTVTPCVTCVKALMASSARRLVAAEEYVNEHTAIAKKMWQGSDREWLIYCRSGDGGFLWNAK